MNDHNDPRTPSIGDQLDDIRWDYNPPAREKRFFLSPMSTFFGAFPWEGAAQTMPVPPGSTPTSPPAGTRGTTSDKGGTE